MRNLMLLSAWFATFHISGKRLSALTREWKTFLACAALIVLAAAPLSGQQAPQPLHGRAQPTAALGQSYGKLPLTFEANQGQTDPSVRFLSRGSGYSLFSQIRKRC